MREPMRLPTHRTATTALAGNRVFGAAGATVDMMLRREIRKVDM
jgi:hypothetical protein